MGGASPRAVPRSRALFARERGQKGEEGGRTFPGGHRRGASLLSPFLAEEGEGALMRGAKEGPKEGRGRGGKRRRCTRHALLTHIFPYLYFIYSTQIEDEKSSFQTKINCVCSLCNLLINYKYNLFFTKSVDLRNHAL